MPAGLVRRQLRRVDAADATPCPTAAAPVPCSAHSSEDLPEPLRPISATTSPAGRSRSTSRTASTAPYRTTTSRAVSTGARPGAGRRGRDGSPPEWTAAAPPGGGRRGPTAAAAPSRRSRPSSTTGGATGESTSTSAGGPETAAPEPVSSTSRSAYCTTRSSRCSAITTVDAEVVHQPGDRGQHVLGGRRVERRGRLVEHQHRRVRGEHRADRDPLLLAARECPKWTAAQLGDAEQVEGLLDPLAHRGRRHGQLLHRVRELVLDRVGDEAGQRVLADDADDVRQLPRRRGPGVQAGDADPAGQPAAGEVRHQPVDRAEQGGLADPGAAGDQAQLALLDGEREVAQHRRRGVLVRDGHRLEADHAAAHAAAHAATARAGPSTDTGGGASQAGSSATSTASVAPSGSPGQPSGSSDG